MSNEDKLPTKRRKLQLSISKPSGSLKDCPNVSPLREEDREGDNESYYSANFKSVCSTVLSEGSPERHVFTEHEAGIVQLFMDLTSEYELLRLQL